MWRKGCRMWSKTKTSAGIFYKPERVKRRIGESEKSLLHLFTLSPFLLFTLSPLLLFTMASCAGRTAVSPGTLYSMPVYKPAEAHQPPAWQQMKGERRTIVA